MFYMKICDFVNFSLAIKLKKKGFREKCFNGKSRTMNATSILNCWNVPNVAKAEN